MYFVIYNKEKEKYTIKEKNNRTLIIKGTHFDSFLKEENLHVIEKQCFIHFVIFCLKIDILKKILFCQSYLYTKTAFHETILLRYSCTFCTLINLANEWMKEYSFSNLPPYRQILFHLFFFSTIKLRSINTLLWRSNIRQKLLLNNI